MRLLEINGLNSLKKIRQTCNSAQESSEGRESMRMSMSLALREISEANIFLWSASEKHYRLFIVTAQSQNQFYIFDMCDF